MKTFRYKLGHEAGSTLTVAELRKQLEKYPDDMPVIASWEGVDAYVHPDHFYVSFVDKGNPDDACDCLVIDAERY